MGECVGGCNGNGEWQQRTCVRGRYVEGESK